MPSVSGCAGSGLGRGWAVAEDPTGYPSQSRGVPVSPLSQEDRTQPGGVKSQGTGTCLGWTGSLSRLSALGTKVVGRGLAGTLTLLITPTA